MLDFRYCSIILALLCGCFFISFLHAADPVLSPGDTDLIRDRQEHLLQEQQKRLEELRILPNHPPQPQPESTDETRCFHVQEIQLQGAEHIRAAAQEKLLKPFIGQCLGASGIDALLKAITGYYLNRGYITSRAYLPEQNLSSGILRIVVIENLQNWQAAVNGP